MDLSMCGPLCYAFWLWRLAARWQGISTSPGVRQSDFQKNGLPSIPAPTNLDPLMESLAKVSVSKEFGLHDKDTGSADVQVALLTARITELTNHLQQFKKDHSSRRGLLRMVNQRRKLLSYLQRTNPSRYDSIIKKLNLRK